jgi:hypothetical protein
MWNLESTQCVPHNGLALQLPTHRSVAAPHMVHRVGIRELQRAGQFITAVTGDHCFNIRLFEFSMTVTMLPRLFVRSFSRFPRKMNNT